MAETHAAPAPQGLLRKHWQKLVALLIWLSLGVAYFIWSRSHVSHEDDVRQLVRFIRETPAGPLIFFALYLLRPLIFFPASLLTIASGYLFGPVLGVVYTVIASNCSSLLAYGIGRFFGQGMLSQGGGLMRYATRMRENSFNTVLLARLIFLHYDAVSYLAGFLRINWRAFIAATAIGALPGTISFVLLGSAITGDFSVGALRFDRRSFGISAAVFVISLIVSRVLRKRDAATSAPETTS
jgi:uncharacterized membrane protein YdjX (TVP38/TMEM64 family)